jgi:Domain of unknown function DUF11
MCSAGGCSSAIFYSMDAGLRPFVRLVPEGANVGASIGILGQGFTGATAVSFNGTAAKFTVLSDSYLTAVVPAGATSGLVAVTTPGGTLKSTKQFLVSPLSADLSVRIEQAPLPVARGGLLTYAFKIWNLGPSVANHEVLTTRVPAGTTFSKLAITGTAGISTCTHPPVGTAGQVICKQGSQMRPGSTWTVWMTVQVIADAGTVITETAGATEDTLDVNLRNNAATVRTTVQ